MYTFGFHDFPDSDACPTFRLEFILATPVSTRTQDFFRFAASAGRMVIHDIELEDVYLPAVPNS